MVVAGKVFRLFEPLSLAETALRFNGYHTRMGLEGSLDIASFLVNLSNGLLIMMEKQITREKYMFRGLRLVDEEYQRLWRLADQKFKNGFTSFQVTLGHKVYTVKYMNTKCSKVNGEYQVTNIFKIIQETDPKLDKLIRELRRKMKRKARATVHVSYILLE